MESLGFCGEMSEIDPQEAAAAAAACPPAIPEEIIAEILALVPELISLFRCSSVCKAWRRIVADPAFLRRRWPEGGSSSLGGPSLLGFFVQRHRINTSAQRKLSRLFPSRAPAFLPAPGSAQLGPERRFLTSFVRDDAGILDEAKPLVARGGLLLVRVAPRSSDKHGVLRLCVYNLLTGRRERLPPLDASLLDGEGVRGYGLVTAADHDAGQPHQLVNGYSTLFQVLLIGVAHEDSHLHLLKFSSAAAGSRRWYSYDCNRRTGLRMWWPKGCSTAAIAGGTAHWIFHGNNTERPSLYTLEVSVDTGRISATMLPFGAFQPWLCTIDARLSLLHIENNNRLVIWSYGYQQDGALAWRPTRFLQIAVEAGLFRTESLSPVCTGESCGTVLMLYHSDPKCAYMLDLRSMSATKVAGWTQSFNYMTAVPFEINWPMFFLSRLGVQL